VKAEAPTARQVLARRLNRQADGCESLGSLLYSSLLRAAASDLDVGTAVWGVLAGFESEPGTAALALRLMGAVHRLVLTGRLPNAARHYPSAGGDGDADAAWHAFRDALVEQRSEIRHLIARGCQTNEVGRSAALLGGFLDVAHRTGLPLRILEIGASAGLNLRWDRYRYESGAVAWGDPASPVRFIDYFEAPPPLLSEAAWQLPSPARGGGAGVGVDVQVIERQGCDLDPIDPTSAEGSLALRSFIWADQKDRFKLLEGAIAVALELPVEVERLDAAGFLERELAAPSSGAATVVYHSVFMQYVGEVGRRRIAQALEEAAARSTVQAPVAWLRMEPAGGSFEVRLNLWPGGAEELVAVARAHGTGVRWLGPHSYRDNP